MEPMRGVAIITGNQREGIALRPLVCNLIKTPRSDDSRLNFIVLLGVPNAETTPPSQRQK